MSSVDSLIQSALLSLPEFEGKTTNIDTRQTVIDLARAEKRDSTFLEGLDFLVSKVSISGHPRLYYKKSKVAATKDTLKGDEWYNLLGLIILRECLSYDDSGDSDPVQFGRRANALFKLDAQENYPWFETEHVLRQEFENRWSLWGEKKPVFSREGEIWSGAVKPQSQTTLPITVLFYDGPIARAYLETFKDLGLRPERIIHLVPSKDVVTKKPVGRFMPTSVRTGYAASHHFKRINFWPRKLEKTHAKVVEHIRQEITKHWKFETPNLASGIQNIPLSHYCDTVELLSVDGLKDPVVKTRLLALEDTTVLFTGGGIVPKSLLGSNMPPFLHIHPGHLPEIRGADCTLWSYIFAARPSATCFYMAPGIDIGNIIKPVWLPQLNLETIEPSDSPTLYRLLYSFIDPWVRAYVLRFVLAKYENFDDLPATPQSEEDGITYYFMTDRLRRHGFSKIFGSSI